MQEVSIYECKIVKLLVYTYKTQCIYKNWKSSINIIIIYKTKNVFSSEVIFMDQIYVFWILT